jgi:DNA-binding transcriptional ArsR family regulator
MRGLGFKQKLQAEKTQRIIYETCLLSGGCTFTQLLHATGLSKRRLSFWLRKMQQAGIIEKKTPTVSEAFQAIIYRTPKGLRVHVSPFPYDKPKKRIFRPGFKVKRFRQDVLRLSRKRERTRYFTTGRFDYV